MLAPEPLVTITVEGAQAPSGTTELHLHAGGQGVWIGRMAHALGADVVVCGPFGGETGAVAAFLAEREGLRVRPIATSGSAGGYVP